MRLQKVPAQNGVTHTPIRRHRPDYQIVLYMGILILLGLIVLFAISPARVELINDGGSSLDQAHFMQRQVTYLAVGLMGFIAAAIIPLTFWKKVSGKILIGGLCACFLLAFLGLFMDGGLVLKSGGATRWFNIGFGTFQPAELLKFGALLFLATFLSRRMATKSINSLHETLIPLGIVVVLSVMLVIGFQKDMGTGITILGMVACMVFIAGLSKKLILATGIAGIVLGVLLIVTSPHRIARVITFFDPASASEASNYHIQMASIAIGSGGFFGKGLGGSIQAFGYLPEAVNDSIFAILGETFGFVGLVIILLIFMMLLRRLLLSVDRVADPYMRLLIAGVFGWVATHVIVNIGAMTGVFPLTGVTLPFLSFGGTSLLFTMTALGIAFHATRYTMHKKIQEGNSDEGTVRGRGLGRTRNTGSRRYQRA